MGTTWWVAASPGFWFQALRPEVYALQAALVLFVVERLLTLEARWPTLDIRPVYGAALAFGLSLSNHHFLGLLVLPAAAPTLARVVRSRGVRPLAWCAALATAGASTFAYLPLRAAQNPPLNLGQPTDLAKFFWVVSAQAFQKNTGSQVPQPWDERMLDVLLQLWTHLHPGMLIVAALGIYVLVRTPVARRLGAAWTLVVVVHLGARAWLGFVRSNPDALGYLMPAFAGVGALGGAFAGSLLSLLGIGKQGRPRLLAQVLAFSALLLGPAQVYRSADRASLARFHAPDAFDEELLRRLPSRGVVVAYDPQTIFRLYGAMAEEQVRPDVTMVPMAFLDYPGFAKTLDTAHPELRELLRGQLYFGKLAQPHLQSLAMQRPLLLELDLRIDPALFSTMVPHGLLYEVLADGATDSDVREALGEQAAAYRRLYDGVARNLSDAETRHRLLWRHFNDSLFFATTGHRDAARSSVQAALAINPLEQHAAALAHALGPTPEKDDAEARAKERQPLEVSTLRAMLSAVD